MKDVISLQCLSLKLSDADILKMIPESVLSDIKNKDPHPFFQVYSICHEGTSTPTMIGKTSRPIHWMRTAIQSIKGKIRRGISFFLGHNKDNSTEGRETLGEIVADDQREIDGKLHHIVVGYFPDKKKVADLDICSQESNWNFFDAMGQTFADAVESITGIALASSKDSRPAFDDARRLGMVQAFVPIQAGGPGSGRRPYGKKSDDKGGGKGKTSSINNLTSKDAKDILNRDMPLPDGVYVHGRNTRTDVESGGGQLTQDLNVGEQYAGDEGEIYLIQSKEGTVDVDYTSPDSADMDKTINYLKKIDPNAPPYDIASDIAQTRDVDVSEVTWENSEWEIRKSFAPSNIVNSAEAYDSEWSQYAGVGIEGEIAIIRTPKGGGVVSDWKNVDRVGLRELSKKTGVQAFDDSGDDHQDKNNQGDLKKMDLTTVNFAELLGELKRRNVQPVQVFTLDEIKGDKEFGKEFAKLEKEQAEKDSKIKTLETEKAEKEKLLLSSTAKSRVETAIKDMKLTEKSKAFILARAEGIKDFTDAGIKTFIEDKVEDFKASVKLGYIKDDLPDQKPDNGDNKDGDKTDYTKAANNELLEADL